MKSASCTDPTLVFLVFSLILMTCGAGSASVGGDPAKARAESLVYNCFTCHGPVGRSKGIIKSLNGLDAGKIKTRLLEFRKGEGDPTVMNRIAAAFTDEEIDIIADYLAGLE